MNVKLQRPHFLQPVKATKVAMLARIEELEQQLASEKQQHQIMDAAYWATKGRAEVAEAKLAVATGLLKETEYTALFGANWFDRVEAFLVDPSQAAAQEQKP